MSYKQMLSHSMENLCRYILTVPHDEVFGHLWKPVEYKIVLQNVIHLQNRSMSWV